MIQGTMSNAGKSFLAAGLCRIFKQDGLRTAPFKSQNMALNSYITRDGLEMGRAQVMQAEAAGIEPEAAMNPILLKPTSNMGSQLIVNGEVRGNYPAAEYFKMKKSLIPDIMDAYNSLASRFDVIVVEGAGSPAEINLRENDIVNMGLAEMLDAPVLLAGDIDRGGVFAQLYGTAALLTEAEQKRIRAFVINKFRGDKEILKPGLSMLYERIRIPFAGVIPYMDVDVDDEDSLSERLTEKHGTGPLLDRSGHAAFAKISVIRLPRISNFTDLMPLESMDEVGVRYVTSASQFGTPDAVILPGSKNTMEDLKWLRQCGLEGKILRHAASGKTVFGICGGYQMMGELLQDPKGVEAGGELKGMGLLPIQTVFAGEKMRTRVQGTFEGLSGSLSSLSQVPLEGYEIHMGVTTYTEEPCPLVQIQEETGERRIRYDGARKNNCYGCYVHGIFDQACVASGFVSALLKEKGYDAGQLERLDWKAYKETQYNKLAEIIRESLDMEYIYQILGKGTRMP